MAYTITDFQKGDPIYHLSNKKLIMAAIEINAEENKITCRWIDKDDRPQVMKFEPEELGKEDDLRTKIYHRTYYPKAMSEDIESKALNYLEEIQKHFLWRRYGDNFEIEFQRQIE